MTDLVELSSRLRPLMFSIAYRMLGSVAESEDVVQDALLRMHASTESLGSPEAYATTVTTRLAIDRLRAARVRRELYVGTWLPEPLVEVAGGADPAVEVEGTADVSMALLVVLGTLSPVERAVFLLREVFGYGYDEISRIVGKSEPNCRQLFRRARARLQDRRPRYEISPARRERVVAQFLAACAEGDLHALESTLAEDVAFYADGGGKAPAVPSPVRGRAHVARFVLGLMRYAAAHHCTVHRVRVNGGPGARLLDDRGNVVAVLALHVADGVVHSLYNVVNPDKLGHPSGVAGHAGSPDDKPGERQ